MNPSPVYILAGPEIGKRNAFVAEIRHALAKKTGQDPEGHKLYSTDASVTDLVLLLRNGSLFSPGRLVEYRGAESVKGKSDVSVLKSYLAAPAGDTVLLLVTDSFSVEKAIEDAVGKECKKTFFEMFENEKNRWIQSKLGALGLSIDDSGIETLLELVENETGALESACLGLAAGFPPGSRLGEAEVEAAVARNRREDSFTLFERIATSDPETALSVLEAVLADRQGGAVQIVSAITWSFRRLQRLHDFCREGTDAEAACFKLGIRGKTAQRQNLAAMKRYSLADCERIIRLIGAMDGLVRSMGTVFERSLMHLLVYGIMVRKGELDPGAQVGAFL
ncbi:MAG: DNA polymerase III subunit delta [Rectinemataceae bacterium]|nr:DNA polymerase III subunit delta [Rectinemataceae bacterium]